MQIVLYKGKGLCCLLEVHTPSEYSLNWQSRFPDAILLYKLNTGHHKKSSCSNTYTEHKFSSKKTTTRNNPS